MTADEILYKLAAKCSVSEQCLSDIEAKLAKYDLTEEEKAALQDETLGREEIIDLLIGKTTEETTEEPKTEPIEALQNLLETLARPFHYALIPVQEPILRFQLLRF